MQRIRRLRKEAQNASDAADELQARMADAELGRVTLQPGEYQQLIAKHGSAIRDFQTAHKVLLCLYDDLLA